MISINNANKLVKTMCCPSCDSTGRLEIALRCDLGTGPCLTTAQCTQCGTSFDVKDLVDATSITPEQKAA